MSQSRFANLRGDNGVSPEENLRLIKEVLRGARSKCCSCSRKHLLYGKTKSGNIFDYFRLAIILGMDGVNNILGDCFGCSGKSIQKRFAEFDNSVYKTRQYKKTMKNGFNIVRDGMCSYCKDLNKLRAVFYCLDLYWKKSRSSIDSEKLISYFKNMIRYYHGDISWKIAKKSFNEFNQRFKRRNYRSGAVMKFDGKDIWLLGSSLWNNVFPETHFKKKVEKKVKVSHVDAIAEHRLEQMLKKQRARQGRAEKMVREFPETGYILGVDCYGADIRYLVVFRKVDGKPVLTWCEISDALGKSGGGGFGRHRTSKKNFYLEVLMNVLRLGSTIRFRTRERPVGFDDAVAKEHLRDILVKLGREHFGTVIEARHSAKEDGFKDTVDTECLEKFRLKIGFPPLAEIGDIQFGVTTNQKSQVGEGEPLFTELTQMERQQQAVKAKNLRNGLSEDYREQKAEKLAQKDAIREKKELKAKAQEEGGMVISQLFDTCPLNVKSKKTRAAFGPKTSKAMVDANVNIGSRCSQATRATAKQTLEIWGGTSCAGGEVDPDSDEEEEDTRFMPRTYFPEDDDEDDTFDDEPELLDLGKKKVLISISAPTNKPLGDAKPTLVTFDRWKEVKPKKSTLLRRRRKKNTTPQPAVAC